MLPRLETPRRLSRRLVGYPALVELANLPGERLIARMSSEKQSSVRELALHSPRDARLSNDNGGRQTRFTTLQTQWLPARSIVTALFESFLSLLFRFVLSLGLVEVIETCGRKR